MTRLTRLTLLAVAALLAAVGASTLALAVVHDQTGASADGHLEGDATWAPGERPAPPIRLTDQTGRPLSLGSLHGDVVMLTFLDTHCREICPTIGAQLASVQRAFPRGQQPVIVVVSVNPAKDSPSSARTFAANMGWSGRWHWLMGDRQQLSRVWQSYGIDVRKLNNDIAHSGAVYLVDKAGDERSGYLSPIAPTLIAHDVKALTGQAASTGLPVLPLIGYLFAASVAAVLVIRLRADASPQDQDDPQRAALPQGFSQRLAAKPAVTVLCTAGLAVVLTLVIAEVSGSPTAAASSAATSSSASGAVIPASARKPSPSLQGAQPLSPGRKPAHVVPGRVTFINFWASWCTPCQQEAPDIARFVRKLPSGASFLGVDVNDRPSNALAFMRRYGLHYAMLSDPDGTLLRRFHAMGLPTTVAIDRHGRIAVALFGPQTQASLQEVLHTLQAEK